MISEEEKAFLYDWTKLWLDEIEKNRGVDYSKEADKTVWAVFPTEPLPENEEIANFIKSVQKSTIENPGIPYCALCWIEIELNEDGDIWCPECGLVIKVEKEK